MQAGLNFTGECEDSIYHTHYISIYVYISVSYVCTCAVHIHFIHTLVFIYAYIRMPPLYVP